MNQSKPKSDSLKPKSMAVAASWFAQVLQVVAGFIVPRLVDQRLGREFLGVWDFSWSMISYFTLIEGGMSSSVNRHVALHYAAGDLPGVNRVVSSIAMIQRFTGSLVLVGTFLVAWLVPLPFLKHSPELERECRWVVGLLGCNVSLAMAGSIYTGVITGRHAWMTQHAIYICTNVASAVGMIAAIFLGWGLTGLALVHLSTELAGRIARAIAAHRILPGLEISLKHATWATAREMMSFGGKMFAGRISQIVMNQTVSVMVASSMGAGALALFARPRSLVRQVSVFPQKYANMLVPSAATLAAKGDAAECREFAVNSTRDGLYVSLPLLCILAVCGEVLMHLWMGKDYGGNRLTLILTLGAIFEVGYQPLNSVLFGLNLHGRPAIASLLGASAAICGTGWVLSSEYKSLEAVALAVVIPWSIAGGFYVPFYACERLKMPVLLFLRQVWIKPLLCMIPFGLGLWVGSAVAPQRPLTSLAGSLSVGGVALAVTYWFFVIPGQWKRRVYGLLPRGIRPGSREPKGVTGQTGLENSETNPSKGGANKIESILK